MFRIFFTSHSSFLSIMTRSREKLKYFLEMRSARAAMSLTTKNTKYSLHKVGESLRQYNINPTCFFYYIRSKTAMRQLSKKIYCVNVWEVQKHLDTRAEHQSRSMSVIIVLCHIFLKLSDSKSCLFQYRLHMISEL